MNNLSKTLVKDLTSIKDIHSVNFFDDFCNEVEPNKATEMNIIIINDTIDIKTIKLPKKKLIDVGYVMNKINSNKVYESFVNDFKTLLPKKYEYSINVYPTTYGIGIFVAYTQRQYILEIKKEIDSILNSKRIEYKNEPSDAGYVFRYKISKSKENINRLKNI